MSVTLDRAKTLNALDSVQATPNTLGLTILFHPSTSRIGDIAHLAEVGSGKHIPVNRLEPVFQLPSGAATEGLVTPFVSRKVMVIEALSSGHVRLSAERGAQVVVDGAPLAAPREFGERDLQAGLVLMVGNAVVLLLHLLQSAGESQPDLGLVGESIAIQRLRAAIRHVADLDVPVLLRGETGVGKELVARAIHECSRRRQREYVCVNMAAITPTVAASELFGHKKSAFTGANRDHAGYFQRADRGTLFLDEIGDAAQEIQTLLLRAVETGQVQPVGAERHETVDVRLIAATDSNLEHQIENGSFRLPLMQRLAGYEIHVPPLRARRDDIGRLFIHLLREELALLGEAKRLDDPRPGEKGWLRASLVAKIASYAWPGNVRQLRNVVRQIAISSRGAAKIQVDPALDRLLSGSQDRTPDQPHSTPKKRKRASSAISDDTIIHALRESSFNISAAASALDVSRTWLFTRMDGCDRIRKASDLEEAEIRRCQEECRGDLDAMVARLEVSKHGLKQRMTRLGIR
jgi:two-component system nitrogen regulation response regulator GlnG